MIISGMPDDVLLSTTRQAEQNGLRVHATFRKPLDLAALRKSFDELYQIPEAVTLVGGYPNQHVSDSTWRTMEVRHAYTASG